MLPVRPVPGNSGDSQQHMQNRFEDTCVFRMQCLYTFVIVCAQIYFTNFEKMRLVSNLHPVSHCPAQTRTGHAWATKIHQIGPVCLEVAVSWASPCQRMQETQLLTC